MVAGILRDNNDSLRAALEKSMVDRLTGLGYTAVSSFDEFGPARFGKLDEEGTYLTLCDSGIDAIITVAMVNPGTMPEPEKGAQEKYTNVFYYNRVWSYRNIPTAASGTFRWECILFDLVSLEPQSVLQAGDMDITKDTLNSARLSDWFTNRLIKNKVLEKRSGEKPPKAF